MTAHEEKTARISKQLKERKEKTPVTIVKKAVSHQVPKEDITENDEKIDLSDLNEIMQIDVRGKSCTAEPGVTFSDLVTETLKYGLVPIVVPELKTITIGGAVVGCSIESMSYKHGGFHDTCMEYELITAKGEILKCTPFNEHREIFQMIHGTFGTLGILTKLKFKLIEAKQYVKLTHKTYTNIEDYKKAILDSTLNPDIDFMDGIIHSPEKFVLCLGKFVDNAPETSSYDWMQVYYKSTAEKEEDYMTTYNYFFRYDSDCHWIARNYGLENPILRFLLGKFLLSSTKMLTTAKKFDFLVNKDKPDVVVDVFIPFSNFSKFFDFYKQEFGHFPLWMVPYRRVRHYEWISKEFMKGIDDNLLIDIAIYGMKQKGDKNYYKIMEDKLIELQGLKTLISHNFYDEETFWKIWNKKNYDKIKSITDPENIFRGLYEKMCKKA